MQIAQMSQMQENLTAKDAKEREGSFVGNAPRGIPLAPCRRISRRGAENAEGKWGGPLEERTACEGAGNQAGRQEAKCPGTHHDVKKTVGSTN